MPTFDPADFPQTRKLVNQRPKILQGVLPLAAPGKKPPRRQAEEVTYSEDEVQAQIVTALRADGWEVLVTSRRRHRPRCPHCRAVLDYCKHCQKSLWQKIKGVLRYVWPLQTDGCDVGIADLLVRGRKHGWPRYVWLSLEVKGPKTPFSNDRQKEFAGDGSIVIVRSVGDARAAVLAFDAWLREGVRHAA